MLVWGERTRSTRRNNARPGRPGESDTGGRGLYIQADRTSYGQQYAVITSPKVEAAKMKQFSWIGTPDALRGACPVWVGAGWNSTAERQHGRHPSTHILVTTCQTISLATSCRSDKLSGRGLRRLPSQLFQEDLRFLEVSRVKTLGEPAIDRC